MLTGNREGHPYENTAWYLYENTEKLPLQNIKVTFPGSFFFVANGKACAARPFCGIVRDRFRLILR